jgi:uncharacterized protein (TIGR02678 family)
MPFRMWRPPVPDTLLADHLQHERTRAARALLRSPLLDIDADPEAFRLVVRHHGWLVERFETTCGWHLTVDSAAGFARLAKRAARVNVSRPLQRDRGTATPFDRRRYEVLCLLAAELVRHPVTTVGLLARAVTADAGLDTSRRAERVALVDALRALMAWGAVRATAGDIDAFVDDERGNAILHAETARLHRLLVSATAPSSLPDDLDHHDTAAAIEALVAEPRYGDAASRPDEVDEDQRLRWIRHTLGRRAVDDPATHDDELSAAERDYLANPAGRKWLRDRVTELGFELEERRDGFVAVDRDAIATDLVFPAPHGNAHQLALLLVDRLVGTDANGRRVIGAISGAELHWFVLDVLTRFPGWAKGHRDGDGPDRLAAEAVDLLAGFGLVCREPDGAVAGRPAIARYRVGEPRITNHAEEDDR